MTDGLILTSSSITTAAIRDRVADAPAWARRAIDEARERRGLPLLFGDRAAPAPAKRPRRPGFNRVLVGAAAPGISRPVKLGVRGEHLPEIVSRAAWAAVKADIERGATFDFVTAHDNGTVIARSDSPDVALTFDPLCGLLFELRDEAADGYRWPAGGEASIGFQPVATTKRMLRSGQWVRQIDRMKLVHIAISPNHRATAFYPAAKVRSVKPEERVRAMLCLRIDAMNAAKEAGL